MANNFKDLLRDLVIEAVTEDVTSGTDEIDDLIEIYHDRFIKEIGKYFELEE